mgnify:CR=1 FL=1
MDMSIEDLMSDVHVFGRTDSSYAFIVGSDGWLLTHPLLPSPQSITDEPIFVQGTNVETAPEAEAVIESMVR